ncbi:MAG: helix-turn-helix transcriptional regulator [Planctomycetota bacterium]|nr:helix-turn-helix transcriptional regulator [Planctomycetota bacterium]
MSGSRFGTELRRLRIAAKRTLKDVAMALGNSVPYVSDIERGRRNPPSLDRIRFLAALFGCPGNADHLAALAIEDRGSIAMTASNHEERELLVALDRRIQSQSLDPTVIKEIQDLLSRNQDRKGEV